MSDKSHIEWTDATWNPTTGCTRISAGCDHCYIETTPPFRIQGRRFDKDGIGGKTGVLLHSDRLDHPLRWKRPRRIFVNSLSDLFHDDVPNDFICDVWATMALTPQHTYQVLTKRPRRMMGLLNDGKFEFEVGSRLNTYVHDHDLYRSPLGDHVFKLLSEDVDDCLGGPLPNVWLGVSVENQEWADKRIPLLLETPAAVRFLSCEPLLGPVDLRPWLGGVCDCGQTVAFSDRMEGHYRDGHLVDLPHEVAMERGYPQDPCGPIRCPLHWVIVGGESGPKARPMHPHWARSLRDQCVAAGVPFFFKQWGQWAPGFGSELDYPKCRFVCNDGEVVGLRAPDVHGPDAFQHPLHVVRKVGKKHAGRELDGRTWDEMPEAVTVGA